MEPSHTSTDCWDAAPLVVPIFTYIVILKYRLYDIDVVINRTLVYGALSVLLALIYFGGVAATQALLRALTGQEEQPQLAVVVSTLVIAALFNPLRHRTQDFIDRGFYRSKYDAGKTLEAFSAKLRDETDLDASSGDLKAVVRDRCSRPTSPCGSGLIRLETLSIRSRDSSVTGVFFGPGRHATVETVHNSQLWRL
jgi:hypothetical protein